MADKQLCMFIDLNKCIGCNACSVACKGENDIPEAAWNTWIDSFDYEEDTNIYRANIPMQCNHCKDAPCVPVCPTGASFFSEVGTVLVDTEACIGCGACVEACPYKVRWVNPDTNTVGKCTFCHERTTNGLLPACVSSCVTQARYFGYMDDESSDVSNLLVENNGGDILHKEFELETHVRYKGLEHLKDYYGKTSVLRGGNIKEISKQFQYLYGKRQAISKPCIHI